MEIKKVRFITVMSLLLFGADKTQQLRLRQSLLAVSLYTAMMLLHIFEARLGLMGAVQLAWLMAFCMISCLTCYGLTRSGVNLRFKDPSYIVVQQLIGGIAVVWTYGISGPERGASLSMLIMVLLFGAMRFQAKAMIQLSITLLSLLASMLLLRHWQDPVDYPGDVDVVNFLYAVGTVAGACVLTSWTAKLHIAYTRQRVALKQALEQIRLLAERDDLTGLINRRAMLPIMRSEMDARRPSSGQLCVVLIDIDRFKSINDKFGHQTGDEALRVFAKIGKATLRAGDVFARWGGEEFLLMLPDHSTAQGRDCLERLRAALAAADFSFVCPGYRLTISAGVTSLREQDRLEAALERADQAMYQAKRTGRDRVVISGEADAVCDDAREHAVLPAAD